MTDMFTIRLFAAARDAAGATEVALPELEPGRTVGDVLDLLVVRYDGPTGQFAQVLARCSFLLDGQQAPRTAVVGDARVLDVLPPFAGG